MADYPQRGNFFAFKAQRQMILTCLPNEIGHAAFTLLVIISQSEDSARYKRAVTWYDDQLMPVAGFSGYKTLKSARDKAVESGWLHYEPGRKRGPGRYWITIPDAYNDIDDSELGFVPSDFPFPTGKRIGQHNGRESGRGLEENQEEERKNNGATLIPSPSPIPDPVPEEDSSEPPQSRRPEPTSTAPVTSLVVISQPAEPPEDGVLEFPVVGNPKRTTWWLTRDKIDQYLTAFPSLDVLGEFRVALQWLRDNPTRRKTALGMGKFLGSWLGRAQNNGNARSVGVASGASREQQRLNSTFAAIARFARDDTPTFGEVGVRENHRELGFAQASYGHD